MTRINDSLIAKSLLKELVFCELKTSIKMNTQALQINSGAVEKHLL